MYMKRIYENRLAYPTKPYKKRQTEILWFSEKMKALLPRFSAAMKLKPKAIFLLLLHPPSQKRLISEASMTKPRLFQ